MELTTEATIAALALLAGLIGAASSTLFALMTLSAAGKLSHQLADSSRTSSELRMIHGLALLLGVPGTFAATAVLFGSLAAMLAAPTAACFIAYSLLELDVNLRKDFCWKLSALLAGTLLMPAHLVQAVRQSRHARRQSKGQAACRARQSVESSIKDIQEALDQLKEWASLSSEQKAEREQLVREVQSATEQLTSTVARLAKCKSDRAGIAFHVEGLKQYPIPAEIMAGLAATLSALADLVEQQKSLAAGELEAIIKARQALLAHKQKLASVQMQPEEVLAMAGDALAVAGKALSAS